MLDAVPKEDLAPLFSDDLPIHYHCRTHHGHAASLAVTGTWERWDDLHRPFRFRFDSEFPVQIEMVSKDG